MPHHAATIHAQIHRLGFMVPMLKSARAKLNLFECMLDGRFAAP
jgi:hypothetical protein